ncbi:hypothetical protein [Streptomyces sp. NPDC014746]|uniref:hypothetical protein n=1 Tax=Streptomyces sp. NPDC014746 TaxID=3364904 RepID=UPI0036FB43DD
MRMRSALVRVGATVVVAAVLASCSDGGGTSEESEGVAASAVCGGFAKDAAATAALKAATGSDRFDDDLSKPEKALDGLRDATRAPLADSYRPLPVPYCWLLPTGGGEKTVIVKLSPTNKAPGLAPEHAKRVTSYASGLQAFSSSGLGFLYFPCDLKEPSHDFVVEVQVWGPPGVPKTDLPQRTRLITLANAAARKVSAELGCQGDRLASGVPVATPNPSASP